MCGFVLVALMLVLVLVTWLVLVLVLVLVLAVCSGDDPSHERPHLWRLQGAGRA